MPVFVVVVFNLFWEMNFIPAYFGSQDIWRGGRDSVKNWEELKVVFVNGRAGWWSSCEIS